MSAFIEKNENVECDQCDGDGGYAANDWGSGWMDCDKCDKSGRIKMDELEWPEYCN